MKFSLLDVVASPSLIEVIEEVLDSSLGIFIIFLIAELVIAAWIVSVFVIKKDKKKNVNTTINIVDDNWEEQDGDEN